MASIAEDQMRHGFEVLAATDCDDGDCPEVVRNPTSGMVGMVGRLTDAAGETREHIAWMTPTEFDQLVGRYRAR